MATLLQSKSARSIGNASSLSITFDNGCKSGSTIVAVFASNQTARNFTASDSTNGAYNVDNAGTHGVSILSFPGNTSTAALSVTGTINTGTTVLYGLIEEWDGILTPTPFDVTAENTGTGTSGTLSSSTALAQAREVAVGGMFVAHQSETSLAVTGPDWIDDPAGQQAGATGTFSGAYTITSTTAALSPNWTWADSVGWRGVYASYKQAGIFGPAQTVASSEGTIGGGVKYSTTAQTISKVIGTVSSEADLTLSAQSVALNEGAILFAVNLGSTSATFTEGTITASLSNNQTYQLSAINAQFVFGIPTDGVSYLLDQNTILILGQTATVSEGVIALERDATLTAFTIASVEGTVTYSLSFGLTAQTIVSLEGNITATSGANQNVVMSSQAIGTSEGVISLEADYFPAAQTITSVEGTITFSNVANNFLMPSLTIGVTEGVITVTGPAVGTGPPLFIPPQLGKPVTTRTFSWSDMAQRAWGSEFRAPDHRIYQFSGGNYKDSTDMGETGIYRRP